jgi:hypothetical protein
MASAFAVAAVEPFPSFTPPAETSCSGSEAGEQSQPESRSSSRAQYLAPSLGQQLSTARSLGKKSGVWRQSMSTAVSDRLSDIGLQSLRDLCEPEGFIPQNRLKKLKALGEGAFAGERDAACYPVRRPGDQQ